MVYLWIILLQEAFLKPVSLSTGTSQVARLVDRSVSLRPNRVRGARIVASSSGPGANKTYRITLLPGDGIGPEILPVAVDVLRLVGSQEGQLWAVENSREQSRLPKGYDSDTFLVSVLTACSVWTVSLGCQGSTLSSRRL